MGVSKLIYNNETLVDLTDVSVSSSNLHASKSAHGADGNSVVGAAASNFPVENALVNGSFSGVYINNRIKVLGNSSALRGLTNITKAILPEVTTLNGYDFDGCTALESVELPKLTTITTAGYNFRNTAITSIAWPSTIIPQYCFNNCKSLEKISLTNITRIMQGAFEGSSLSGTVYTPSLQYIGPATFKSCNSLKHINLISLISAVNANNQIVGYIDGGFQSCSSLEEAYLPNFTKGASNNIFNGCTALQTVVMPKLPSLSGKCFLNCSSLTKADFGPATFNFVNNSNQFQNCTVLSTFIIRSASVANLLGIATFSGTPFASGGAGGTFYVPAALIDSYKAATNWSTILGYENNSILPIEGSQYENYYANGAPIAASSTFEWWAGDATLEDVGWTKTISGTASISYSDEGAILTSTATSSDYCHLQYESAAKGAMEVKLSLSSMSTNWNTRVAISNGTNGIQVFAHDGQWKLVNNTTPNNCTAIATASTNTEYKIYLELYDGVGLVKINDELVASNIQSSSILYCGGGARVWSQGQQGSTFIKAIKFWTLT